MSDSDTSEESVNIASIRDGIVSDNAYFKNMINLIPAKFYFDADTFHKLSQPRHEKKKDNVPGNKGKAKKRQNAIPEGRSQWKKVKYDPQASTSVTAMMDELSAKESSAEGSIQNHKFVHSKKAKAIASAATAIETSTSADQLQSKYQDKLNLLKAQRKSPGSGTSQEEKRLKRKEKKMKSKMQRKRATKEKTPKEPTKKEKKKLTPGKPVYNKEGKMVFSKFDFDETGKLYKDKQNNLPTGKNYKKLLDVLSKKKQKLEELKDKDQQKAKTTEEKMAWKSVLMKAEGTKVKDNPELIKKSMKRQEKRKAKSKKDWKDRDDRVKQKVDERQEKRKTNIKSKKQAKINKKIKRAKKKGRILPGFS
eukprot:GHVU01185174.1.p1 GENE.GHVU01185174.1~~GHVU01185174.1.p1  ORF type:complete len:364 (+),score=82.89 GHVU01185174.1:253-1344(+)